MADVRVRKTVLIEDRLESEMGEAAAQAVTRMAAVAVFENPLAGRREADLGALWDAGGALGEHLATMLVARFEHPVVSYGKAAVVGTEGEFEHGGALCHPKLGKPMRAAIGGGKALIPSNVKVGPAGTWVDLPLGHKDEPWSFDHFDTLTVAVPDAPRPGELMLVVAFADGGRLFPRCGDGPVTT